MKLRIYKRMDDVDLLVETINAPQFVPRIGETVCLLLDEIKIIDVIYSFLNDKEDSVVEVVGINIYD